MESDDKRSRRDCERPFVDLKLQAVARLPQLRHARGINHSACRMQQKAQRVENYRER